MKKALPLFVVVFFLFTGCSKDNNDVTNVPTAKPLLDMKLSFRVDGAPLEFDTIKYMNAAGNNYSVTTLKFYLSQVYLLKPDSTEILFREWIYVDALSGATHRITSDSIPAGEYIGMKFNIGIDAAHNVVNGLPVTIENLEMEWPVFMGGGYHFLKMEGHFTDTSGTPGYAMHLGNNHAICPVTVFGNFCAGQSCESVTLTANINEWFRTPYTYDLNLDGNYIMGDSLAMSKIAGNGIDVFSIQ
jgi:hypothetical protein